MYWPVSWQCFDGENMVSFSVLFRIGWVRAAVFNKGHRFCSDMRKSRCYRDYYNTTLPPYATVCEPEDALTVDVTEFQCCCLFGAAWGSPCRVCPARGTRESPCLGWWLQFSSRWYLRTLKSPYAHHAVSHKFLQCCLWDSSSVRLIDNGPLLSFQGRLSSASSFHAWWLQVSHSVCVVAC